MLSPSFNVFQSSHCCQIGFSVPYFRPVVLSLWPFCLLSFEQKISLFGEYFCFYVNSGFFLHMHCVYRSSCFREFTLCTLVCLVFFTKHLFLCVKFLSCFIPISGWIICSSPFHQYSAFSLVAVSTL